MTILTLVLTACGASAKTPQAGPANQDRTLPLATQLIVGTFKLDGTAQAVTADEAKQLLPLWQVYKDLSTSDTAAPEEVTGLVEQVQETMTKEQIQSITEMNLTQRDIFTLMQEKGLSFAGRNNSANGNGNGNSTSSANSSRGNGNGGFTGPGGGFFPGGGGFDGGGGFPGGTTQRNSSQSTTRNSTNNNTTRSNTSTQSRFNPASILLDPLITLLKQKAGVS